MEAKFTGKSTSKAQSIEQALRRLKYLHTSLMPHEGSTLRNNGNKLDDRISWTKELKSRHEEQQQVTRARRTPEKQCSLSLQPKTPSSSREKVKPRVVKRKQKKKAIRTGRAPLQAYRVPSSSVTANEILQSKSDGNDGIERISRDNPVCKERISKSASGVFYANDPHKCIQCLTKNFCENAHRQKPTKEYFTNMRINRVTFSARPSGYKVKSVRESKSKIEAPVSCFFNGWGVRSNMESLQRGDTNNDLKRQAAKETMDVTVGLKTLKLEHKMQQGQTKQTIPQPPPTPVRQIDIKLPQGVMVRYQLSEDD